MLGPPKPRRLDEPITVSLEDLVPQNHFDRHLAAKLDLGFVRGWSRERYAERGRPSVDTVVFFKLQLVMFFEGIRSERKLIDTASLHLAHRWYLGYALDEDLPDHSSLTRIRKRLGIDVFQRFFEQIVDMCQEVLKISRIGWSGCRVEKRLQGYQWLTRPGTCWRNGGSTLTARQLGVTSGRVPGA